jgi:hypothetical protein
MSTALGLAAGLAELFESLKGDFGRGGAAKGFLGAVGICVIVSDQAEEPVGGLLLAR